MFHYTYSILIVLYLSLPFNIFWPYQHKQYINMRTYMRRRPYIQGVIEGVHKLCRLCLQESEEMLPIFDEDSDGICATLSLRIMICVGLQIIRDDNLPNTICSTCNKELERYYIFRKKCEVSYQKLKLHLQAIKEKERLRKAIEEKELEEEIMIKQEVVNNNPDNESENITKYVLDKNQFSEIQLLDLNGLASVNLQTENIQESNNIPAELANYVESKEIETQIEDADNPEISSFLSTVLVQLGILGQQDETLSILESGVNNIELMMGDDDAVVLELVEEDDDDSMETSQAIEVGSSLQPVDIKSIAVENLNDNLSKNSHGTLANSEVEEQVMTIKWKPEEVGSVPGGGGGRAWCSACRKWLASRGTLRRHLRVHTGEKPFACKDCGRRFAQREVLQRHRFVHLEHRPFACEVCGKSFTQRGALLSHARAHPPPHARALQLHACTRCPKVFLSESAHDDAQGTDIRLRRVPAAVPRQELAHSPPEGQRARQPRRRTATRRQTRRRTRARTHQRTRCGLTPHLSATEVRDLTRSTSKPGLRPKFLSPERHAELDGHTITDVRVIHCAS